MLDPHERVLLAEGKSIHLTDKVFDTLLLLIQNNGRLLTKDEMMTTLWEESFVEEGNLAKNISRLRKILNTDGSQLIETLPKRGYRFAAQVRQIDSGGVGRDPRTSGVWVPDAQRPTFPAIGNLRDCALPPRALGWQRLSASLQG